jgi:YVTN family beta-propeller protein
VADEDLRERLGHLLAAYEPESSADAAASVLAAVERRPGFRLLILGETTSDSSTLNLLQGVKARRADLAVLVVSTCPTVEHATVAMRRGAEDFMQGSPSHGIGIAPDGKTLWAASKWYHLVAAYSMPDLKPLGIVAVGHYPDWLTFSPDSAYVYVACAGSNSVSVVDMKRMTEVAKIGVGQMPKRNITAVLQ